MAESKSRVRDLFLDKPECIINLPEWMISNEQINEFRKQSGLAIIEMAGRDSVAAAIKSVKEEGFTDLLPTYVYTGTEFGSWASVPEAVARMKKQLPANVKVHDLLVFGSPGFWQALNGRYAGELMNKYGFYTPCIGCHLYLHSTRIPLAVLLGNKPVITGERESHDGRIKINQIPETLDAYRELAERFDISLLMPLRDIKDGRQIEDILGMDWEQDGDQLGCVLSGNYRDKNGKNIIKKEDAKKFLNNFALPVAEKITGAYLEGLVPDHIGVAREILEANN